MKAGNDLNQLQLSGRELAEVRRVLRAHVPEYSVGAFGSRVTGRARQFSDLDLVILTESPLPLTVKADLTAGFEEADLAFKVDVVDWSVISPEFKSIIEKDKVVIQKGRNNRDKKNG